MARTQMRKERIERAESARVDPITGRRRDELFTSDDAGEDAAGDRTGNGGLLPVAPAAPTSAEANGRAARPGQEQASTTSIPPASTLLGPPSGLPPSVGMREPVGAASSSAARILPPGVTPGATQSRLSTTQMGGSRPFERPLPPRGGAITGGVRAGAPAVRPGYGTGGVTNDLNAGRLLGGLPPSQGPGMQGGAPGFRGFVPRSSAPPAGGTNAGRPLGGGAGRTSPPSTPTEFYGP